MTSGVIIPRTPFEGPVWRRCGHPKTEENTVVHRGQYTFSCCRFCSRVRTMNANALKSERRREETRMKAARRYG